MPDLWGPLPIPNVPPEEGEAAGDPLLSTLLSYLRAFLVDDDNGEAAWDAPGVAPRMAFMQKVFAHDPRRREFNERDLPSLYGWRSEMQAPDQVADDIRTRVSVLTLLWVFPTAPQAFQASRDPMINAIGHGVDLAIERGRTPSWVVAGDPDPLAAMFGSLVWTFLSVARLNAGTVRPAALDVPVKGGEMRSYAAVEMTITVEEILTIDLTRFDAMAGGGLDLKLVDTTGAILLAEDLVPPVV
jgi:hypothetical protein